MAKKRKSTAQKVMAQGRRDEYVAALREGRRERAHTYADRRKVADKRACRGKVAW